jgi:hypothetical protein
MGNLRKQDEAYCVNTGNMFMLVVSEVLLENLESKWATMERWEDA